MRNKNCLCGRSLIDEVCRIVDAGGNDVSFATIESSMYKRSRTGMPSLPTDPCHADAAITGSRLRRWEMRRSTAVQWTLATVTQLDIRQRRTARAILRSCRLMYVDATFRMVPSLFYQLFTVFIQHTNHSFPVTHWTMIQKTTALYQGVF